MAKTKGTGVSNYSHPQERSPMRPEVGVQGQFKKKKPPQKYRYDSSLAPALNWDGQNPAREQGEALLEELSRGLAQIDADLKKGLISVDPQSSAAESLARLEAAVRELKAMSRPFLDWAGKAERLSFDVPTLPLFIHERLSTQAIIETLKSHRQDRQLDLIDIYGDPRHSIHDQLTKAYEYLDEWRNRMILGDSLAVMNSLLHWDRLGGQVQMIYLDPPYGVKFGSNFQPFVRKRDVKHNDDAEMTREPEMVQAYRDTWELGLHSYLTYLRDRLLLARELLTPSGSIFVQISDENLHHVRELMDEIFGTENFVSVISYVTTSGIPTNALSRAGDYLLWYARQKEGMKYRQLFQPKQLGDEIAAEYKWLRLPDGSSRTMTKEELSGASPLPDGARPFRYGPLTSPGATVEGSKPFVYQGKEFRPGPTNHWKVTQNGLENLVKENLMIARGTSLAYYLFLDSFPVAPINNIWSDTKWGFDAGNKAYVVQTNTKIVERCIQMTTDPGDLVLDPTCGSGTTAYVAEQWGRRWITIDTSRVPLALARQRLLTSTFSYYELKDELLGPAGGFVYKRKQNKKGEEVGGIVPHITLKSIANNEPPAEEILVDRPEVKSGIVRVTGPFTFEATIPTPLDDSPQIDADERGSGKKKDQRESEKISGGNEGGFVERMIEILRKSPVIRLDGNRTVTFKNVRQPARTMWLSAEAAVDASALAAAPTLTDIVQEAREANGGMLPLSQQSVAIVFGPENGAVSERLVFEAAKEANMKGYAHLYVIGFAIQPNARTLIESSAELGSVPMTYVQATLDLLMGDLLKNMRSSQIFSVCGLPEIALRKLRKDGKTQYQVELLGLDVFDPITMENDHRKGGDVPAWLLDTNYNGNCFHVSHAFFPRTSAWDNLKKSLKGYYEEDVWSHLAGTTSAPFEAGDERRIAVKVIDDRGNELMVVKDLKEAVQEKSK
jgi:adenine-specific DNA-methyltransferase